MKAATSISAHAITFHVISIHAAREGGDVRKILSLANRAISIHAAREGGDWFVGDYSQDNSISIHAAREGGDRRLPRLLPTPSAFQSTPPVKAATAETYKCNQHFRKQQVRK